MADSTAALYAHVVLRHLCQAAVSLCLPSLSALPAGPAATGAAVSGEGRHTGHTLLNTGHTQLCTVHCV